MYNVNCIDTKFKEQLWLTLFTDTVTCYSLNNQEVKISASSAAVEKTKVHSKMAVVNYSECSNVCLCVCVCTFVFTCSNESIIIIIKTVVFTNQSEI